MGIGSLRTWMEAGPFTYPLEGAALLSQNKIVPHALPYRTLRSRAQGASLLSQAFVSVTDFP